MINQIKTKTLSYFDQTKQVVASLKQLALEKVNSLFAVSPAIVTSLENSLNAAENLLDYLLPRQPTEPAPANKPSSPADSGSYIKLVTHMGQVSDAIRKRVVDYAHHKWLPAVLGSALLIKEKAATSLNGSTPGKVANGSPARSKAT